MSKRQLALALGSYLALLMVSLVILASESVDLDVLRAVDGALVALTLVSMQVASMGSPFIPSLRDYLTLPAMTWRLLGVLSGGTLLALIAASLLGAVMPFSDIDLMALYRAQGHGMGMAMVDLSLITPLVEEALFRGLILGALMGPVGRRGALWVSSLMFASAHLSPVSFVHHTLLGLVCGHARLETKGLLVPMLIHGVYNAVIVWMSW